MLATLGDARRSTRPTGCSRSSGTATASRRSSATERSRRFTRNGNDAAHYFPGLLSPVTWIAADRARSSTARSSPSTPTARRSFELLQQRISGDPAVADAPLVYMAFDLLYLDGRSLLKVPLEDRKRLLQSVLREHARVRFAGHVERRGQDLLRGGRGAALEGIVAKRRTSRYEPGRRTDNWLKIKVRPEQELVVGGYVPGEGSAQGPRRRARRRLRGRRASRYAGRVGSGMDGRTRKIAQDPARCARPCRLPVRPGARRARASSARRASPSRRSSSAPSSPRGPATGTVRQTAFKGILEGRDPHSVVRERAGRGAGRVGRRQVEARVDAGRRAGRRAGDAPGKGRARKDRAPKNLRSMHDLDGAGPTGRRRTTPTPNEAEGPTGATADELEALGRARARGRLAHRRSGAQAHEPRQGALPAPPGDARRAADHEARPHRLLRPDRPGHAAAPRGAAAQPQPVPQRRRRPELLAEGHPSTAPAWLRRWREQWEQGWHGDHPIGPEHRDANTHLVADEVATLCWLGNQASFEIHAWTSRLDAPMRPTYALIDIDPGDKTTWEETLTLARLFRTALGHLGVAASRR